jgi:hypothetical protein
MEIKILEIRDSGTFFPMLCINLGKADNEGQRYLMRRVGYPLDGRPNVAVCHLRCDNDKITNDPCQQEGRTYPVAHSYIIDHWDELKDGDVVDVRFILKETSEPCPSERGETIFDLYDDECIPGN